MKQRKIMVLINLDKPQGALIQNAINIAQKMDGKLLFFYVRKAADVVQNANQFSAIRSVTEAHVEVEKRLKGLLQPYQEKTPVKMESHFAFGNIKNEIKDQLHQYQPDLVVMGKRSSSSLPLMGDQLTDFVLNQFQGTVLVSALDQGFEANEHLSIGLLSGALERPQGLAEELLSTSKVPLKTFRIKSNTEEADKEKAPAGTVQYVFSEGTDAVKNLSKYVLKNNVHLLCINRTSKTDATASNSNMKEVMQNLPVSLLMTGA